MELFQHFSLYYTFIKSIFFKINEQLKKKNYCLPKENLKEGMNKMKNCKGISVLPENIFYKTRWKGGYLLL